MKGDEDHLLIHVDDAPLAVGIAVLDLFACGAGTVVVTRDDDTGGYLVEERP